MANNPGAKKAIRKIEHRTEVNKSRRSRVRTFLRKFDEAVASGDQGAAQAAFTTAQSELMRRRWLRPEFPSPIPYCPDFIG